MTKPRQKILLVAGVLVALGAGTAAAVIVRDRREVTTSSAEAYRLYLKGLEDERRLYSKDALSEYAKALELDPHFAMATLRLAGILAARDRERATALVQCARSSRDALTERERLAFDIFESDIVRRDPKRTGELVREYVRRFPDDPEGYFRLCGVLMREGKTEEMVETYGRLLALDPNQAAAYNALGYHFIGRRDFVKAEDYLKRYRFLAPDQANPYDSLGELYANTGRYDEAEEHLKRALEIKPDFIPAIGHLGTLEAGRGHAAAAAAYLRRAGEMSESAKEKVAFASACGMALLDAGRPDDALAALDQAAATISPTLAPKDEYFLRSAVVRSRSALLALAGREAEAEAELAGIPAAPADLDPKEKAAAEKALLGPRAAIASARGDREEAVRLLRAFLSEEKAAGGGEFSYYPGVFQLRTRLANALVKLGRPDEARDELRPVLAVNPRFAPALDVIARIEGRAGAVEGTAGR